MELGDLAIETATSIVAAYDWQALSTRATITGNGALEAFSLPSDYKKMPLDPGFYSTRSFYKMSKANDLNQWLEFKINGFTSSIGMWMIIGGKLNILPVLGLGETVQFYYQSKNSVVTLTGEADAFKTDTDIFKLSERLITLGVIWRWRNQKGLDDTQDRINYDIALQEEIGRDHPRPVLRIGTPRISGDINTAYPGLITP